MAHVASGYWIHIPPHDACWMLLQVMRCKASCFFSSEHDSSHKFYKCDKSSVSANEYPFMIDDDTMKELYSLACCDERSSIISLINRDISIRLCFMTNDEEGFIRLCAINMMNRSRRHESWISICILMLDWRVLTICICRIMKSGSISLWLSPSKRGNICPLNL